jgi:hypothetical protein
MFVFESIKAFLDSIRVYNIELYQIFTEIISEQTAWSRVLLLVNNLSTISGIRSFIIVFTRTRQLFHMYTLYWKSFHRQCGSYLRRDSLQLMYVLISHSEMTLKWIALLAACFMLVSCLGYTWTLKMGRYLPPKRWLTHSGLHCVISLDTGTLLNLNRSDLFRYFRVIRVSALTEITSGQP